MWPYWFLFCCFACAAMSQVHVSRPGRPGFSVRWHVQWFAALLLLSLAVGLRHEVGGDWGRYLWHVDSLQGEPFSRVWQRGDPAHASLNWIAANIGGGIYLVNMVCATLFSWGLLTFAQAQPRPWLAVLVAIPYLVTVVAMGYTTQGVAIGLVMLAFTALQRNDLLRFVLWVALAATFHKSAVTLLPLAVFAVRRVRLSVLVGILLSTAVLYVLLLQKTVDSLITNYIVAEYSSSGAALRISMNAVPALLFLVYRKRFLLSDTQRKFWTWMSIAAVCFVPLLVVSPSSTALDRVALYWIPLQLFVLSRLPDLLGRRGVEAYIWVYIIVIYSAAVLAVWLLFASHAHAWLPYQFYPWVLINTP
tara:strand:- start:1891 stop:2976 length:1086 start_codon:yes stop_codon:yes gene_type:complete